MTYLNVEFTGRQSEQLVDVLLLLTNKPVGWPVINDSDDDRILGECGQRKR